MRKGYKKHSPACSISKVFTLGFLHLLLRWTSFLCLSIRCSLLNVLPQTSQACSRPPLQHGNLSSEMQSEGGGGGTGSSSTMSVTIQHRLQLGSIPELLFSWWKQALYCRLHSPVSLEDMDQLEALWSESGGAIRPEPILDRGKYVHPYPYPPHPPKK